MMEYKGYRGVVAFDYEAGIFHGEVVDTRDVITFQGQSVAELCNAFEDSIDEYLKFCTERGKVPDKPFSGRIPLRVRPDVHRAATAAARSEGKSLNAWLSETIERATAQTG
jgi:predicted HicB family RNase H-like nuclease